MTYVIEMYQGEDFSQRLSYFTDETLGAPLVFTNPVLEVRAKSTLYARFDTTGTAAGLITPDGDGVIVLSMPYTATAVIKAGDYPLDVFADVMRDGLLKREAISKIGVMQLQVAARSTVDEGP
jgi:hypothetical protein